MRREAFAEVGGSLMIASITGLYTIGGLASACYAFLAFHPSLNALGLIFLLFGAVNLPLFVLWSRQTANEIATWTDSLVPDTRRLPALRWSGEHGNGGPSATW